MNVFKFLRYTGLPFLTRELIQRRKVTILLFHDIRLEDAEKSFSFLKKKYNIIGLNDFIEAVEYKTSLPPKAAILTFDDGHLGNFKLVPLFKKLNIPVTIFLCSSVVNTNREFWFNYKNLPIGKNSLKIKSNRERLEILKKAGFDPLKELEKPSGLQKVHIEAMKEMVNFQSHTMFHPILPNCTNEEATQEIKQSKTDLEKNFGLNINAFSYPNGDYSIRDEIIVKDSGYKCAITVDCGYNNLESDLFRLKRLSVNDTGDINELSVKASGLWAILKNKFSKLLNAKA